MYLKMENGVQIDARLLGRQIKPSGGPQNWMLRAGCVSFWMDASIRGRNIYHKPDEKPPGGMRFL